MFFLWLSLSAVFLLCLPRLRMLGKRLIMSAKLGSVCRKHKGRLRPFHSFWMFGRRDRALWDFELETENEILFVKLFGMTHRTATLVFKESQSYCCRYCLTLISGIGVRVRLPFDGRVKSFRAWELPKTLPEKREGKAVKALLLIHPACCEIRYLPERGPERILCRGDVIGEGFRLESLSGLIQSLKQ